MHLPSPALDVRRVADLRALGGEDCPELADEVARIFVQASREGIEKLRAAAAEASVAGVIHEAHRIRGSSGNVGALVLAALCATLEQAARGAGQINLPGVAAVELELTRVLEAMAVEFDLEA